MCVCIPKRGIYVAFQQVFGGVGGDSAVFRFKVGGFMFKFEYLCLI